jgi:hypothetical protein
MTLLNPAAALTSALLPAAARSLAARLCAALLCSALLAGSARADDERKAMKLVVHPANLGSKPALFRVKLGEAAAAALKGSGAALIKFDGLEGPSQASLILRVFVAAPEATLGTSLEDKRYVGNLTLLAAGKTAKGKKRHSMNAQVELSAEAKAAVLAAGELAITLVPADAEGKEPADADYSIKKISLSL